ncbi:MAG: Cof-type HAD-IIB family hydrolase, partial [Rikenellaceae bacterium]|nr:Cof-type HAD-IIB family hydrolase [Rikenellaceae bacterium]
TLASLRELRARGVRLFIATGRPASIVDNLGDLRFDGYVTLNGGVCIVDDRIIYRRSIPNDDIKALLEYNDSHDRFPCIFVLDGVMAMLNRNDTVDSVMTMLNIKMPRPSSRAEILSGNVYQILAFFAPDNDTEVMRHMPGSETTRWTELFTDIIPQGSNKGVGLEKMLAHFGLKKEECMAFGDGGNDIEMLRYAGIGVAMGNASDNVKASADYVTSTVDDDGIRNALLHFGLL